MTSYHDLYITTASIPRTRISALPYGIEVTCSRAGGWRVWHTHVCGADALLGGEYDGPSAWLRLDVNGIVIVDSSPPVAASAV